MKLRDYQKNLNKPAKKFIMSVRGKIAQIYAPTGSGKTVCFTELIKYAIKHGKTNIAVLHPRIALSQDQLRRFKKEVGTNVTYTSFHSGAHIIGQETIREKSTLDPNELNRIITQSIDDLKKPHITFSSYQSFDKLIGLIEFDLVICDEAQYLVQEQFFSWISKIPGKVLCYTATPITDDMEGISMDCSVFGPVLAQVEPKILIKPGYIVAPLIERLECSTNKRGKEVDVVDIVARAFVSQHKKITSHGMPYHQMLVACRNVEVDIREIENNLVTLWTKIQQISEGELTTQIDVYTIEAGGAFKNGRPMVSRDAAIEEIKSSGKNAIIAHYDTLSEGIDIDTLTGAVLMRKMSKAKLIQTIGRCARPYIGDLDPKTKEPRKDLYDLEKGIDLRKKPRCIITLPVIDGQWIANDDGTQIAKAFIAAGYEDLITYMNKSDDTPKGSPKTTFTLSDDPTVMSAVLTHKVERELVELRKLFDFKD